MFFHSVLQTPGRSIPWVDDSYNYSPAGGLEPGEQDEWRLDGNPEWGNAPKDRDDMVLTTTIERYETAAGNEIAITDNSDKIDELKQQIAALRAKLPPETAQEEIVTDEPEPPLDEDEQLDEPMPEYRTWASANGKFKVEAEFVKFEDGKAYLQRKDSGKEISVSVGKLSKEDQEFIRDLLKSRSGI